MKFKVSGEDLICLECEQVCDIGDGFVVGRTAQYGCECGCGRSILVVNLDDLL